MGRRNQPKTPAQKKKCQAKKHTGDKKTQYADEVKQEVKVEHEKSPLDYARELSQALENDARGEYLSPYSGAYAYAIAHHEALVQYGLIQYEPESANRVHFCHKVIGELLANKGPKVEEVQNVTKAEHEQNISNLRQHFDKNGNFVGYVEQVKQYLEQHPELTMDERGFYKRDNVMSIRPGVDNDMVEVDLCKRPRCKSLGSRTAEMDNLLGNQLDAEALGDGV